MADSCHVHFGSHSVMARTSSALPRSDRPTSDRPSRRLPTNGPPTNDLPRSGPPTNDLPTNDPPTNGPPTTGPAHESPHQHPAVQSRPFQVPPTHDVPALLSAAHWAAFHGPSTSCSPVSSTSPSATCEVPRAASSEPVPLERVNSWTVEGGGGVVRRDEVDLTGATTSGVRQGHRRGGAAQQGLDLVRGEVRPVLEQQRHGAGHHGSRLRGATALEPVGRRTEPRGRRSRGRSPGLRSDTMERPGAITSTRRWSHPCWRRPGPRRRWSSRCPGCRPTRQR